jgi:oxygen-independent coproporphyrinogen-3 oxidase
MGGGTPSLLPIDQMQRLVMGIRERFDLSCLKEWTVEANPATVSGEYCQMLRAAGVDRLSFGAQSFNREELKILERHHQPEEVVSSLELARSAGFERINLDLIFSIPGQTMTSWMESLEMAISLKTTHLSCYALTYEPNTPIAVRRRMGQLNVVTEDLEMQMLHATRDRMMAAGIPPYEISNFAVAGQECQHNLNYWTGGNYIGLGPSAASHVEGWRWKNRPHLGEWEAAIDSSSLPVAESETLTPRQRLGELAMLMLRLERGLDLAYCRNRLSVDANIEFAGTIERLARLGLISSTGETIHLTRSGIGVADALAAEFLG